MPPGDYIVALGQPEAVLRHTGWYDPDVLDALARSARRVSLREGDRATMTLRVP